MSMDYRQEDAINFTGANILVSASAGAGKTRVLVERLIKRCLKDKVSLDEILAVTFTKAAAAEMKSRVAARLQEELEQTQDTERKEWIDAQMVLLESADITTIDAFCLTIIKKYYNTIGLDPAAARNTLDDGKKKQLMDIAFQKALAEYDKDHHERLIQCLEYTSARPENFSAFQEIITDLLTHAENDPDPDAWFAHALEARRPVSSLRQLDPRLMSSFYDALHLHIETIENTLQRMLEFAEVSEKVAKNKDDIAAALNRIPLLYTALDQENYALFRERVKAFGDDLKTPSDTKLDEYKDIRKTLTDKMKGLVSILYPEEVFLKDMEDNYVIAETMIDCARLTGAYFKKEKIAGTCMDFADMERYAWEILNRNNGAVARLYRSRLKEVMVDEFQDTSTLQNQIIEKISEPGTIFRVGDVKQSIYRFRQAKPGLMRTLMHDPDAHRIVLEHNYRSKENIVAFCNLLFGKLMNIDGCEDRYDENDTVSIGSDRQKLDAPDPIEFILIEKPEKNNDEETPSSKQLKAEWIAAMIQQLHAEGKPYKANAVLVRSHNDKPILRQVFDRCGIPYDIDAREGFFQSKLCQDILALLKYLCDGNDDIALLTILTSSLYRFSDETLAHLRIRYGSVRSGIEQAHPDILQEMEELRIYARKNGLSDLLSTIARFHRFYETITDKDRANFDFLFEKVVQLEQTASSLNDLITFMESAADEKSSEAVSRSRDDDVVTVTTIHQSKGLQYPYVYLWSTGRNSMQDTRKLVMVDDDLYLGMSHLDFPERTRRTGIARIAIEHKDDREDLEEFTRILYVALTRAEEKLFIVDTDNNAQAMEERMSLAVLARRKGMTGLISAALNDIPDLFRIVHTAPVDPTPGKTITEERTKKLPFFSRSVPMLDPISRPSDSEVLTYLPDLNPSPTDGKAYGIKIHEIIEALPDTGWTKKDLEKYDLPARTVEQLLAFAGSDLYRQCLNMEIHKEYPFYVEDAVRHKRSYGSIDFAAIGEKEIILIDFKTDAADGAELKRRYHAQIEEYRSALAFLYPNKIIHAYIWSLHNDIPVKMW